MEEKSEYMGEKEENKSHLRELKNGAIYDMNVGHIVKAPPNDRQIINQETARDFHKLRKEKALAAIQSGMKSARDTFQHEYDAIEAMTQSITRIALDNGNRDAVLAYKTLLEKGQFVDNGDKEGLASGINVHISGEIVSNLLKSMGIFPQE